jgi:hypothetical protein
MKNKFGFEKEELATLRRLTTTEKIQAFLDEEIRYNKELSGATCRSPRRVLRDRVAHCIEGALFAAAALRCLGYPPVIVDLEAVRDDDHVISIFKKRGHWGAIAKSNYAGLRFREPVYRSLRELVMSYFEHYYNLEGEKTLRTYSRPVQLARFDSISWMTTEKDLWPINDYLCSLPHRPLLTPAMLRKKRRMDARLYRAGLIGTVK